VNKTRKRDGRRMTDAEVEAADAWHWISIGQATVKLLERLIKHHSKEENAPRAKQGASSRSGSGEQAHGPESNALAGSIPAVSITSTRATSTGKDQRRHEHQ
jgi:hypothetical protein